MGIYIYMAKGMLNMAASTAEMRYAVNGTYGSSAYDLDRLQGAALPQEQVYDIPGSMPEEEKRERSAARESAQSRAEAIERAKSAQSVSVAAVVGFAVIGVLMVFVLLSYVRLAELTGNISRLSNTITELQAQQKKIDVEYELAFNLNEVEEYATNVLGMTKLAESNTTVLTMERADKAEILSYDDATGRGFVSTAKEFISSLAEYLR